MQHTVLTIFVIFLYLCGTWMQVLRLRGKVQVRKFPVLLIGLMAVFIHGYLLHLWIDIGLQQNLAVVNVISMITWLSAAVVIILSIRQPIENLLILMFPLAVLSIILVDLFPGQNMIATGANPRNLFHILFSLLTFSILIIAAVQAIVLAIQEWLLRQKRLLSIIQMLPALETMEIFLFQLIILGFIGLSIDLITSFIFFHSIFTPPLLNKTILSLLTWFVFAILLVGRYHYGWRGKTAIRWTLSGVVLLILAYLSSQILTQLI